MENKAIETEEIENIIEETSKGIEFTKESVEEAEKKKKGKCPPISRKTFKIMCALIIVGMVIATVMLVFAIIGMFS